MCLDDFAGDRLILACSVLRVIQNRPILPGGAIKRGRTAINQVLVKKYRLIGLPGKLRIINLNTLKGQLNPNGLFFMHACRKDTLSLAMNLELDLDATSTGTVSMTAITFLVCYLKSSQGWSQRYQ